MQLSVGVSVFTGRNLLFSFNYFTLELIIHFPHIISRAAATSRAFFSSLKYSNICAAFWMEQKNEKKVRAHSRRYSNFHECAHCTDVVFSLLSSLLHRARFHSFTLPKWIAALVAKCENYLLLFVCSFYFCAHRVLALFSLFVWLSGDPSDCQERLATSSSNARAEAATAAALILIWIVYESIYLNPPFYPPRKLNSSSHSRVWKGGGNELQSKRVKNYKRADDNHKSETSWNDSIVIILLLCCCCICADSTREFFLCAPAKTVISYHNVIQQI